MFGVLETISSLRKYEKRAASLAAQYGKAMERRSAWWTCFYAHDIYRWRRN